MALPLNTIYDAMVRQFTTSSASRRFNDDFLDAVNNALDDIWATGALDTQPTHATNYTEECSVLGPEHRAAFMKGIIYHLISLGQKHSGIERDTARAEWEDAKGDIMVIERRAEQADEDDDGDPSNDIVGLGYVGDL